MLLQMEPKTKIEAEPEVFSNRERPGIQIAKDIYSLISENFQSIDKNHNGCISNDEIDQFNGNQRLKDFLHTNMPLLSKLSFSAKSTSDLIHDCFLRQETEHVSYSDLNTFSWLCQDINRRNFYDGNFQSLREGAGLNVSTIAFIVGILAGWSILGLLFNKLHIFLHPAEAIGVGVVATVCIPLLFAFIGYKLATAIADAYFFDRINRIDQILEHLERA